MKPHPITSDSLLVRVRDSNDAEAWDRFDKIYRPIVYRIARRFGWQDSDSEDLAQRVMVAVSKAIPDWEKDPNRGSFRTWLSRIARNTLINMLRGRKHDAALGGTDFLDKSLLVESSDEQIDLLIEREHDRACLRAAAEQIRGEFKSSSWSAFWLTTLDQLSVAEAAEHLSISVGSVYAARSRIMRRLQQQAKTIQTNEPEDQ